MTKVHVLICLWRCLPKLILHFQELPYFIWYSRIDFKLFCDFNLSLERKERTQICSLSMNLSKLIFVYFENNEFIYISCIFFLYLTVLILYTFLYFLVIFQKNQSMQSDIFVNMYLCLKKIGLHFVTEKGYGIWMLDQVGLIISLTNLQLPSRLHRQDVDM